MGKRITRIYHHQIVAALSSLSQQPIHVIMWKGQTFFGTLLSHTDTTLIVEDKGTFWYNRKKHTHTLAISDIREIITERQSEE